MNATDFRPLPGSVWVLSAAFTAALIINLALLLMIGGLISRREASLASAPKPVPVDFIRVVRKVEEPKPVPPAAPKTMADVAPEHQPSSKPQPPAKRPTSNPIKPTVSGAPRRSSRTNAPKAGKEQAKLPGVPAPRLDIPEQGTGAPFAPAAGSDARLTAPPAQWNIEKKPEPSPGEQKESDGEGESGGLDSEKLVVVSRVLPDYPARAQARGIEGWVRLEIEVTSTGAVSHAKVVDASPKDLFDRPALEAIRRWRFKPAYREGRAVPQRATLKMVFRLTRR